MPKISYQEIVTADVSESGTVTHEWEYSVSDDIFPTLIHKIDGLCDKVMYNSDAIKMWSQLCRSKK